MIKPFKLGTGRSNKGDVLATLTTVIFLAVLTACLVLLTLIIAVMQVKGTSGGTASLSAEIKSEYSDERAILYWTDDYGNKLTDLIGQVLLYPQDSEMILPTSDDIESSGWAIDNSDYDCPNSPVVISTEDTTYSLQKVELRKYVHCLVVPKKLAVAYGKTKYCLFAVYDELGPDQKNVTFGNETLSPIPGCGGGKLVSANIAPPPGFTKPISIRLEKA